VTDQHRLRHPLIRAGCADRYARPGERVVDAYFSSTGAGTPLWTFGGSDARPAILDTSAPGRQAPATARSARPGSAQVPRSDCTGGRHTPPWGDRQPTPAGGCEARSSRVAAGDLRASNVELHWIGRPLTVTSGSFATSAGRGHASFDVRDPTTTMRTERAGWKSYGRRSAS
jgi:hypothetical protein